MLAKTAVCTWRSTSRDGVSCNVIEWQPATARMLKPAAARMTNVCNLLFNMDMLREDAVRIGVLYGVRTLQFQSLVIVGNISSADRRVSSLAGSPDGVTTSPTAGPTASDPAPIVATAPGFLPLAEFRSNSKTTVLPSLAHEETTTWVTAKSDHNSFGFVAFVDRNKLALNYHNRS